MQPTQHYFFSCTLNKELHDSNFSLCVHVCLSQENEAASVNP